MKGTCVQISSSIYGSKDMSGTSPAHLHFPSQFQKQHRSIMNVNFDLTWNDPFNKIMQGKSPWPTCLPLYQKAGS